MEPNNLHRKSKEQGTNQGLFDKSMREKHKADLGLDLPKDYFSRSRKEILENINTSKRPKLVILSKRNIGWSLAAAIALLITLNVFRTSGISGIGDVDTVVSDTLNQYKNSQLAIEEDVQDQDDILVISLFIDDSEIDEYIDSYVFIYFTIIKIRMISW